MSLTSPGKWHGGKSYLAKRIVALMPPRCQNPNKPSPEDKGWLHYIEPYFGMGAVLLELDPEGISEVANDLNQNLTIFWRVLGSDAHFPEFIRRVQAIPFSEVEFKQEPQVEMHPGQETPYLTAVETAVRFFVRCRQSLSGRMDSFAGITRNRTRRGMNEQVSAWLNAIEGLPVVHARMKRVLIRDQKAVDVIRKEDGSRTLYYCDPPYLHETRATTGEYEHEMTESDHRELLETLANIKGRFLLSDYESPLYDSFETTCRWKCHKFDLPNNSAGGDKKERRTECVWTNF